VNILELEKTIDQWARKSELPGLSIDVDGQLANLNAFVCLTYRNWPIIGSIEPPRQ